MKAALYTSYAPPGAVLQIKDVEKPVPKDDEVLIRVRAAGVNPFDSHLMKGGPYIVAYCMGWANQKSNNLALPWLARSKRSAGT
jgi:NADPH:quinone reductase-like Zn-dependent oxidoreductase